MRFLALKSYKLPKKMLIVKDAHLLSLPAANAFLKTLEEPPNNSFIAICAPGLEDVLPTIASRCRKIFLPAAASDHAACGIDHLVQFLEGGQIKFRDRKKFAAFLWTLIMLLRGQLLAKIGMGNNQLRDTGQCEIILARYSLKQIQLLLEEVMVVYASYRTVNMNLGLQVIKTKL